MRLALAAFAALSLAGPAVAQTVPTCAQADIACRVQHNDTVTLGTKLDTLHTDIQALIKQLQSAPVATGSTSSGATSAPATSDAKYFPAEPGNAAFPSPENSSIIRLGSAISGRPYLRDDAGNVHQMVQAAGAATNGYLINGNPALGGGSDQAPITKLVVRQGKVFSTAAGGQTQQFNFGMGGLYNAALPDAFSTDASGATTSTVATSSVTMPSKPARAAIAPGSTGKILKVCATGCAYPTLSAAIAAAANGDTVDLGPGTYKEAPPAIAVSLKMIWEAGAVLDLTGLTGSLAHGKGAIVPMSDLLLVNPVITGTAMDQGSAQGTAAIRPETGSNYIDVQGGELYGNQNGIAGGDVPVVLTVTDTKLHDNGLGDGYTHNIYMSHGTLSVTLNNVQSTNPNGGHAAKIRAFELAITGGTYEAFSAASIDVPDGTVAAAIIDGATIIKKAGAYNHTVLDYATEDTSSGNGGLVLRNVTLNLACDSPAIMVGGGSVVTVEATTKVDGTKPTAQGGTVKGL